MKRMKGRPRGSLAQERAIGRAQLSQQERAQMLAEQQARQDLRAQGKQLDITDREKTLRNITQRQQQNALRARTQETIKRRENQALALIESAAQQVRDLVTTPDGARALAAKSISLAELSKPSELDSIQAERQMIQLREQARAADAQKTRAQEETLFAQAAKAEQIALDKAQETTRATTTQFMFYQEYQLQVSAIPRFTAERSLAQAARSEATVQTAETQQKISETQGYVTDTLVQTNSKTELIADAAYRTYVALQTVKENIATLDTKIAAVEAKRSEAVANLATYESQVTTAATEIEGLSKTLDSLVSSRSDLLRKLQENQANLDMYRTMRPGEIDATTQNLLNQQQAINTAIAAVESEIQTTQNTITSLEDSMSKANADRMTALSEKTRAELEAADLAKRRVADAEAAFQVSSGRLDTARVAVDSLETQITGVQNEIDALLEQAKVIGPLKEGKQAELKALQDTLAAMEAAYDAAVNTLNGMTAARDSLGQSIAELQGIESAIQTQLDATGVPSKTAAQLAAEQGAKDSLDALDTLATNTADAAADVKTATSLAENANTNLQPDGQAAQIYQNALSEYQAANTTLDTAIQNSNSLYSTIRAKLQSLFSLLKLRAQALFSLQTSLATFQKRVFEFQQQTFKNLSDQLNQTMNSFADSLESGISKAREAFSNFTSLFVREQLNTTLLDKLRAQFLNQANTLENGVMELAAMREGIQQGINDLKPLIENGKQLIESLKYHIAQLMNDKDASKAKLDAAIAAKAEIEAKLAEHVHLQAQLEQLLQNSNDQFSFQETRATLAAQGTAKEGYSNTVEYFATRAEAATDVKAHQLEAAASAAKAEAANSFQTLQALEQQIQTLDASKPALEDALQGTQTEIKTASEQLVQIQTDSTLLNTDSADAAKIAALAEANKNMKTAATELSSALAESATIQDGIIDANNNIQETVDNLPDTVAAVNTTFATREVAKTALDTAVNQEAALQNQMDSTTNSINTGIKTVNQLHNLMTDLLNGKAEFEAAQQQQQNYTVSQNIFQSMRSALGLQVQRADGLADTFRNAVQANYQNAESMRAKLEEILPYVTSGKMVLDSADISMYNSVIQQLQANLEQAADTRIAAKNQLEATQNDSAKRNQLNNANIEALLSLTKIRDGLILTATMNLQRGYNAALLGGIKDGLETIQKSESDANIQSKLDQTAREKILQDTKKDAALVLKNLQDMNATREQLEKQIQDTKNQKDALDTKISQEKDAALKLKLQGLSDNTGKLLEAMQNVQKATYNLNENNTEITAIVKDIQNLQNLTDTNKLNDLFNRLQDALKRRNDLNLAVRAALNEQLKLQQENSKLQQEIQIMQTAKNMLNESNKTGNKQTFLMGALAFAALGIVGAAALGSFGSPSSGIGLPGMPVIPGVADIDEYWAGYRDGKAKAIVDGGVAGYRKGFNDALLAWAAARAGPFAITDLISGSNSEDVSGATDLSGTTDLSGAATPAQEGGQVQITQQELRDEDVPSLEDAPPLPGEDPTLTATMPASAPPEPEPAPPEEEPVDPQDTLQRIQPWMEAAPTVTAPAEIPVPNEWEITIPYPAGRSQSYLRGFRDGYMAGFPLGFRAQYLVGWNMYDPGRDILGLARKALPEVQRLGEGEGAAEPTEEVEPPAPEGEERPVKPEEEVVPTLESEKADPVIAAVEPSLYDDDALIMEAQRPPDEVAPTT